MWTKSFQGLTACSLRHVRAATITPQSVYGARCLVTGGKKEWLCIMPDKPNVADIRKRVKR